MVTSSESGQDAIVFPMVGLTIPLYRKKYSSMAKESALMQESANNNKMNKLNQLESAFDKAFRDYKDAERRISLYRELSDKASRSLNILKTAYETDGKNFEDLLHMEQQLLKYEIELEKASSGKNAAFAFMNYLMGN